MRCACGYGDEYHPDGRCPLCACGMSPGEHLLVADPPAPLLTWEGSTLHVCPGKERTAAGHLPTMRRGKLRDVEQVERRDWFGMSVPVLARDEPEDEAVTTGPPRVPARLTLSLDEIAPRARPLGTAAAELGWTVTPWYWVAYDGTETSALVLARDGLRAAAYWHRAPGAGWKTGGTMAWRDGEWPRKLAVTALHAAIVEVGETA